MNRRFVLPIVLLAMLVCAPGALADFTTPPKGWKLHHDQAKQVAVWFPNDWEVLPGKGPEEVLRAKSNDGYVLLYSLSSDRVEAFLKEREANFRGLKMRQVGSQEVVVIGANGPARAFDWSAKGMQPVRLLIWRHRNAHFGAVIPAPPARKSVDTLLLSGIVDSVKDTSSEPVQTAQPPVKPPVKPATSEPEEELDF
jgi:hypothetical protein